MLNEPTIKKILLVEDDIFLLRVLEEYLTRRGFEVVALHSGSLALEEIESLRVKFDLAIVDCVLPGAEGITVAQAFAKIYPLCQILMISGYPVVTGKALGCIPPLEVDITFLPKPFTMAQFMMEVEKLLNG